MKRVDLLRLRTRQLRHRLDPRYPRTIRVRVRGAPSVAFRVTGRRDLYDVTSLGNEPHFVGALLDRLEPSDEFYDIGAHLGLIALLAAPRVRGVVAFEPDQVLGDKLLESSVSNPFGNIRLERAAVGDTRGVVTLWSRGPGRGSPALAERPGYVGTEVPLVDLDSYIEREDVEAPSAVKIDVEGYEAAVLGGMKRMLAAPNRPRLLAIELHPGGLRRHGSSIENVVDHLRDLGYVRVWGRPRGRQEHVIWEAR